MKRNEIINPWIIIFMVSVLIGLLICITVNIAGARISPQLIQEWGNIDPGWVPWFQQQRSPHGVPCCNVADGHPTEYEIRGNAYWVPIEGVWQQVPEEAIIHGTKNPTGRAVVWYVPQGKMYYIRCFINLSDV